MSERRVPVHAPGAVIRHCGDKKPIGSRIVHKVKYRANGEYDKHKGRLVAKGFQAVPGVDLFSTFTLARMGTLTTVGPDDSDQNPSCSNFITNLI